MVEALINYGILFTIVFVLIGVTAIIKKSKVLSSIFSSLGKTALILLQLALLFVFTICISLIVGFIIVIQPFVFGEPQFFSNGEVLHFLAIDDLALLSFSLTYGVLYIIGLFICLRFIVRSKAGKFFYKLAKRIRQTFHYGYRQPKDRLENRIMTTASQLMISTILLFLYPLIINLLFPSLEITFTGSFIIFIVLLIFSAVPLPNTANQRQRQRQRNYRPQTRTARNRF